MGRGKGKAVVNIICFLRSQSQGRFTISFFVFPVENDPAFSRTVIVSVCLCSKG